VIAPAEISTAGSAEISCVVENTGDRPGEEVVQLYVRSAVARTVRPRRELKAFHRLALDPGESRRVSFTFHAERSALFDPSDGWVVEPGLLQMLIGSSSEKIHLQGDLNIGGETRPVGRGRALVTEAT